MSPYTLRYECKDSIHTTKHFITMINFYNYTFQLCTGGSVTDLVQGLRSRGAQLSEKQISYILRETIQALIYLHENHCMHRDIKGKIAKEQ